MTALAEPGAATDVERLCHDLRQYVAAGLIAADMPGDECLDDGVRQRLATIRLLFSNMSDLVMLHSGEARARSRVLDLAELVDDCVRVVALNHDVTFAVEHPEPVVVAVEATLLRRAVTNVLDNASRATGAGGCVRVGVRTGEDFSCVEVADEGLGFGHAPPGTGQGMAIVDTALRACRGRLEILSGPGPGTTVRLLVPNKDGGRG